MTTCIRCNTPYAPGGHFCHVCGLAHDRPNPGPTLELLAGQSGLVAGPGQDFVLRPAPTGDRPARKPSLSARVIAALRAAAREQ